MNGWLRGIVVASILGIPATGLQSNHARAAGCDAPTPIRFRHGQTEARIAGGIIRAEEVCYVLSARAGQQMQADTTSPDGNGVFSLYQPGYSIKPASDGPDISGPTLPGAGDQDDATTVRATLPASGHYLSCSAPSAAAAPGCCRRSSRRARRHFTLTRRV